MTDRISRTTLESGLRIVSEPLPHLRSVTLGAWVGTGARDETDALSGASHFLEHLLFKGSDTRSAREIAEMVEAVGGEMNAFTAHEQTVFYLRVPDDQLELGVDVLCDVLWRPAFRADEVDCERQVILEEIAMRDDTPDDLVHDVFAEAVFAGHVLSRAVIGFPATIEAMTPSAIASYHAEHYRSTNTVFAAAGNFDEDRLRALVEQHSPVPRSDRPIRPLGNPTAAPDAVTVVERDTEQAHVVLGMRSLPHLDPDRYALMVLNQVLGGGMASRLFQEVREARGLAYSVYSFRAAYQDTGCLGVYAGTSVERVHETLDLVHEQFDRLVTEGTITVRELDAAKGNMRGSLAMSLETSSSRMHRIGRAELVDAEIPSLDEVARRVDAVSLDDIARVVDRVVRDQPRVLSAVGPFTAGSFER